MSHSLDSFKFWLAQNDRSPGSIRRHAFNIQNIFNNTSELSKLEVDKYFYCLKEKGRRNVYIYTLINTLRVYSQFLKGSNLPYDESLLGYKYPKKEPFLKATMSDDEIEKFLTLPCPTCRVVCHFTGKESIRQTNPVGWSHFSLFWKICAYTGMRMGEGAHLKIDDVDFGRGVFLLEITKTKVPRYVPIPPSLSEEVQKHVDSLDGAYLFPSKKGGKKDFAPVYDSVDWHYSFKRRLGIMGIKRKNLTPYSLRHSLITRMLEEDVNLFKVQKLVGHSDLRTTAHYTHLTTKDLIKTIKEDRLTKKRLSPLEKLRNLREMISKYALDNDILIEERDVEDGFSVLVRPKKQFA